MLDKISGPISAKNHTACSAYIGNPTHTSPFNRAGFTLQSCPFLFSHRRSLKAANAYPRPSPAPLRNETVAVVIPSFIMNCRTVVHSSHCGAFTEDLLCTRHFFPCWRSRQELIRYVTYLLGGRLAASNQKDTMPSHGGKSYEEIRITVRRWGGSKV